MKKLAILFLYLCLSIIISNNLYSQSDTTEIYTKNGGLLKFDADTLIFYFNSGAVNKFTSKEIRAIKFESKTNVFDDYISDISEIINYPNPFSQETTISFKYKGDGFASITIFDEQGHKVRIINSYISNSGMVNIVWDGKDENGNLCKSGSYFFSLEVGKIIKTGKLLLIL